jgi:hypothetical protein
MGSDRQRCKVTAVGVGYLALALPLLLRQPARVCRENLLVRRQPRVWLVHCCEPWRIPLRRISRSLRSISRAGCGSLIRGIVGGGGQFRLLGCGIRFSNCRGSGGLARCCCCTSLCCCFPCRRTRLGMVGRTPAGLRRRGFCCRR